MKQIRDIKGLVAILGESGIPVNKSAEKRLTVYERLLREWSRRMNLISAGTVSNIVKAHFLPSAFLASTLEKSGDATVLDIGSGAGFPGAVIKILYPELGVYLLDSSGKKISFLRELGEALEIHLQLINERVESFIEKNEVTFDVVVARAVTDLDELVDWSEKLTGGNGKLLALKGGEFTHPPALERLNISLIRPDDYWGKFSSEILSKYVVRVEFHGK